MHERVARLEALLGEVEAAGDAAALAAVQLLLDLYREGLARIMATLADADTALPARLARDEVVSHLLLLHGLHPAEVESRVRQALAEVRPHLASHGGDAELIGVADGVARLRLLGRCAAHAPEAAELRAAIEAALERRAPDLLGVEADEPPPPAPSLVQLGAARTASSAPAG